MTTSAVQPLHVPLTALIFASETPDWTGALCADPGLNPELWHPFPTEDAGVAVEVCHRCPLRAECLQFGKTNRLLSYRCHLKPACHQPAMLFVKHPHLFCTLHALIISERVRRFLSPK